MKKYLFILAVVFVSCSKDPVQKTLAVNGPSIVAVKFFPVYAGGNESTGFDVDLIADSNLVTKVVLYLSPNLMRWEVKKPSTGRYRMYDHVGDFPTYSMSYFYYFSFEMKDGTVINEKPFQVY